jgi:GAF domain-containing protein
MDNHVQRSNTLPIPHLENAINDKKPAIYLENGSACATIPLILREQIIGVIKLKSPNTTWNEDDLAIIEAVSRQAALALENARLIQDTISRAQQEKMLSEVSSHMRETLDVETILQTAARDMRDVLNLAEVEVRITPNPISRSETN